ncbi:peroxisomal leader peptide-processing protease-like [Elysia marginata]|uniref:Peroxisomal leader peptide-processing protease n=1 Tax=Elysia marginata TaxID=1093978 RepID=A0AAV4FG16_9GAST|nr:peroxisomal leader peptide-processing protease-like [Elysia marginata]
MTDEDKASLTSLACVMKATFPGLKDTYSTCGLLLHPGEGFLLSHGSILADLCSSNKVLLSKVNAGEVILSTDLDGSKFTALLDRYWRPVDLSVTQAPVAATDSANCRSRYQESNFFSHLKCRFLGAFRVVDFHDAVCKIMPGDNWSFANGIEEESITPVGSKNCEEGSDDLSKSVSFQLLSYFLVLQCCPLVDQTGNSILPVLLSGKPSTKKQCALGAEAEIISTPFGGLNPYVFFNSYSRGVISNIHGHNGCWILTDARCIPGSEGGPLFTVHQKGARQLAGIVAASLCWKNKEWVGLSLACGIDSVIFTLTSHIKRSLSALNWHKLESALSSHQSENLAVQHGVTANENGRKSLSFLPFVVLIKVGRVWGSGFVVDTRKCLILTCSHVVRDASPSDPPIFIRAYNNSRLFKATVVYRQTSEAINPFDLAVLRCPEVMRYLAPLKPPKVVPALIGQRVWVFGHAVFNTDLGLQPSVCAGVISKVVKVRGQDMMVQTTCAVHGGASGGPLLDNDGNLVGIVVCNTVDKGSNSTYPHINFSVPATTVWPTVLHYIQTSDASVMNSLKVTDPLVKKLWALETPLGKLNQR